MNKSTSIAQSHPIETKRAALLIRRNADIQRFVEAVNRNEKLGRFYREIKRTSQFINTLDQISMELQQPQTDMPRFVISSFFLHECFKKLTADKNEQFSFITGVELEGWLVLNQLIELEHEKRTVVGVSADPRFTHRLLITLESFRHRLLGHFHSHPGNGPDSTHPSGTDENFQTRLEKAGHQAVAAIFSRDGFIRFFRMDNRFEVKVFGEGAEQHEQNIFKLTNLH